MDSGARRDPTWVDTGERGTVRAPARGDGRRGPPWERTDRPAGRPPDPPEDRKPPPATQRLPHAGRIAADRTGSLPAQAPAVNRTATLPGARPVDRPPGIFYRPARPTGDDRPGRWVLTGAFWAGLVAAIAPWWFNTPSSALSSTAAALIAAGRITGLITRY